VEYLPDRNLKCEEFLRFGTYGYIHEHNSVLLLGATGSGKNYPTCVLGNDVSKTVSDCKVYLFAGFTGVF